MKETIRKICKYAFKKKYKFNLSADSFFRKIDNSAFPFISKLRRTWPNIVIFTLNVIRVKNHICKENYCNNNNNATGIHTSQRKDYCHFYLTEVKTFLVVIHGIKW